MIKNEQSLFSFLLTPFKKTVPEKWSFSFLGREIEFGKSNEWNIKRRKNEQKLSGSQNDTVIFKKRDE